MAQKTERLDKILASQNIGSRKEVRNLIRRGAVTVNGSAVRNAEIKLNPEEEKIYINGVLLPFKRHTYLMMNKPAGVLSAAKDPKAKTVVDLLPKEQFRRGIFPAGRLDKDTTGLLILTDDGDFAHKMLAPKSHVFKIYRALLDSPISDADKSAFSNGIPMGDFTALPAELWDGGIVSEKPCAWVKIREGKFHQVKRMFLSCGKTVIALHRQQIGLLKLDPDLPVGQAKELSEEEISLIFS